MGKERINKLKVTQGHYFFVLFRICAYLLFSVAKKKSIFNDRQIEIEELTNIIKTDLSSLNKQIAKLQELGRKQREGNAQGHHIASHSSSVVVTLQSKLANMSNHFKNVLEVRSEVSKYLISSTRLRAWEITALAFFNSDG